MYFPQDRISISSNVIRPSIAFERNDCEVEYIATIYARAAFETNSVTVISLYPLFCNHVFDNVIEIKLNTNIYILYLNSTSRNKYIKLLLATISCISNNLLFDSSICITIIKCKYEKKRERDYNNRFEDRGRIVGDIQRWSFTKRMVKVLDDEWNEVVAALKCLSRSNYYFTYLSIQNFIVSWTFLLCQYIVVRFRLNNDTWFDNQFIIFLCIFQRIILRILILLVEQQQLPLNETSPSSSSW